MRASRLVWGPLSVVALLLGGPVGVVPSAAAPQRQRLVVLAQNESPDWRVKFDTNPRGVSTEARASNGTARLTGSCATALLAPGFWMALSDVPGLPRVDGRRMTLTFAITGGFGTESFKARVRYEAPGDTWPTEGPLPPAFLAAFETGGLLTISDPSGRKLGEFNLRGAEELGRQMRRVCRL